MMTDSITTLHMIKPTFAVRVIARADLHDDWSKITYPIYPGELLLFAGTTRQLWEAHQFRSVAAAQRWLRHEWLIKRQVRVPGDWTTMAPAQVFQIVEIVPTVGAVYAMDCTVTEVMPS